MSNGMYYDKIHALITERGELGVNEIARQIDVPLSTVQKYLERQSFFKKTERRKWDLPDNVNTDIKSDTIVLMVNAVENSLLLLKAQLSDIQLNVQNSLVPIDTLKRGVSSLITPVAVKSVNTVNYDPELLNLDIRVKELYDVFKKFSGIVPEMYKDLIKNVDLYKLVIEKGFLYLSGGFNTELSSLFLEKTDTLSDEVVNVLTTYQRGA